MLINLNLCGIIPYTLLPIKSISQKFYIILCVLYDALVFNNFYFLLTIAVTDTTYLDGEKNALGEGGGGH